MNWRRVVVVVLGGAGAVFLLAGAFAREPVWMAIGAVCAFAGVATVSLMLSRQITWLAGEVGNARGFVVDKVLTLSAQVKAQGGLLTAQEAATSRLRSLFTEHAKANQTEQRTRLEHLEAVANELFVSVRRETVTDAESVHREIGAIASDVKSLQEGLTGTVAAHTEGLAHLRETLSGEVVGSLTKNLNTLLRLQDEIRSEVADGANLAMRTYRELTDSVEESSRLTRLHHDEVTQRLLVGIESVAKSEELLAGLEDIKRTASSEESVRAGLALLGKMTGVIEDLRSFLVDTHHADKKGLKDFVSDEKKLRKMSQLSMQWLKTEILQEIEALSQLRPLLRVEGATPLLGGWAMDAAAVHSLVGIIRERRPLRIVEFGSGSSTIWVALALRSIGCGRIVSFDHLELYGQRTREAIHEQGLEDFAEVRVRELVSTEVGGEKFDWYGLRETESLGPIDVLLVDGPPGGTGPMARFPAIPILWSQLADDALIVVDDASRPDEKRMLESWRERFPDLGEPESIGARTLLLQRRSDARARTRK